MKLKMFNQTSMSVLARRILPKQSPLPTPPFSSPCQGEDGRGQRTFKKMMLAFITFPFIYSTLLFAADNLTDPLQKGLLEEEGNHNLEEAIKLYQSVVTQSDEGRKTVATAIFRLGECYRKQGKTAEATAQYQRILREFSDQEPLVKISQQNLTAIGVMTSVTATVSGDPTATTSEEAEEIRRIKAMIQNSPDLINAKDAKGKTPLFKAASLDQLMVAKFLLINKADIEIGMLQEAADKGYKAMVELLLDHGAEVDSRYEGGATALHYAVLHNRKIVVEVLLQHKADINIKGSCHESRQASPSPVWESSITPLQIAVCKDNLNMIQLLLDRGAEINATNDNGSTALHYAVANGNRNTIETLLVKGADIHAKDLKGQTPLFYIYLNHQTEQNQKILETLLKNKADINARDLEEKTPLFCTIEGTDKRLADLLIKNNADVNAVDKNGTTPLIHTVLRGLLSQSILGMLDTHWEQFAEQLLKQGADPNLQFKETSGTLTKPRHSLMHAVVIEAPDYMEPPFAKLLLVYGADINAKDENGDTPVHWAVSNMVVSERIGWLLDHKADINTKNTKGQTPYDLVLLAGTSPKNKEDEDSEVQIINGKKSKILDLLREHGAVEGTPKENKK